MSHVASTTVGIPMDPRIERTRARVVDAATKLLVEGGPAAVTMDGVSERSGVAKSTIYRHWASRDELLTAVFEHAAPRLDPPAPGLSFEASARAVVGQLVEVLRDPDWAEMLPALLLLKFHEAGPAKVEQQLETHQSEVMAEVLDRGVAEGRVAAGYDLGECTAQLAGPLVFAHLSGLVEITPAYGERVLARFLRAVAPD